MKNKNSMLPLIIGIVVIALIVIAVRVYPLVNAATGSSDSSGAEELAKCLTDKGVKMYGAYWCGHCNNQKELFGEAFQYVDYVECEEEQGACVAAGVTGYPTWVINNKNYPGEKSFDQLRELAGC